MKKMKSLMALTSVLIILSACNTNKAKEQAAVGNDRDEHDCIGSAGYVWSEVREDCIRPFETGVKLQDCKNTDSTTAAFWYSLQIHRKRNFFTNSRQRCHPRQTRSSLEK